MNSGVQPPGSTQSPPGAGGAPGQGRSAPWMVIALSAGALSAVLFSGVATPSLLSIIMFYFAPAPLFMVGVAFGWLATGIAAVVAGALLSVMLNPLAASFHFLGMGAPAAWLAWLGWKHRPGQAGAPPPEGEPVDEQGHEWYPEGRLLLWMAGIAATVVALMLITFGGLDAEGIRAALRRMATAFLKAAQEAGRITPQGSEGLVEFFVVAGPPATVVIWLLSLYSSFRLASWLAHRFRLGGRAHAPFHRLAFPQSAMLALAGLSLTAFLPGMGGLLGELFAIAWMTAFVILGLAVSHAYAANKPWRPWLLAFIYLTLIAMTWLAAFPLLLLGLAEAGFGLREKNGWGAPPRAGPPART